MAEQTQLQKTPSETETAVQVQAPVVVVVSLSPLSSSSDDVDKMCGQLFEKVRRIYVEGRKLSNDLLSVLQFVFQSPLMPALELVEKEAVTRIVSQSGREIFQIIGSSGNPYVCFPNLKYCTCPAYQYSVLTQEDYIMCKHVLAMNLAVAMGVSKEMTVSDEETSRMIQDMD